MNIKESTNKILKEYMFLYGSFQSNSQTGSPSLDRPEIGKYSNKTYTRRDEYPYDDIKSKYDNIPNNIAISDGYEGPENEDYETDRSMDFLKQFTDDTDFVFVYPFNGRADPGMYDKNYNYYGGSVSQVGYKPSSNGGQSLNMGPTDDRKKIHRKYVENKLKKIINKIIKEQINF